MNCIVRWMLRISDFIKKIMNLNYYLSSRHVRKKALQFLVPLSIFCGLGTFYLTDLCLTWTWFLMISGNPSSKCQRVWLQIRPTFDTSICTKLKGLFSEWGMLSPARVLMRGSRIFCPENFHFASFLEGDP